jgi:hypothetical protein
MSLVSGLVIFLLLRYAHLVVLPVLDFGFSAPVLRVVCCRWCLVLPLGPLTPGCVSFSSFILTHPRLPFAAHAFLAQ